MKKLSNFFLLFFCVLTSQSVLGTHYTVYLLGGQSNAAGRGDASELVTPYDSPQPDVLFYWHKTLSASNGNLTQDTWVALQPGSGHGYNNPTGHLVEFGSEVSFGRKIADAHPNQNIAIIKYAHGGSNLHTQWASGGSRYNTFINTVTAALADLTANGHTYDIAGMWWVQGEADTGNLQNANNYESNLTDLIARIRADINNGVSFPFIISGLSDSQYSNITTVGTGRYIVRQAQEAVAANDGNVGFVNTDGLGVYNVGATGIHFNTSGQLNIGDLVADKMLQMTQKPSKPNVVIIYTDDMGFSDIGAYGDLYNTPSPASTPNLDSLAAEGMIFTQAHSSNAVCTPSRYALLTGKYDWRAIAPGVGGNFGEQELPNADVTIAEYLKTQDYQTAAFGKWHLGANFYDRQGQLHEGRYITLTNADTVDWERPVEGHATDHGFDVFKGLPVAINFAPYLYMDGNRLQYFDTLTNAYRDALNTDYYHYFSNAELNDGLGNGQGGAGSRSGLGDPTYKQIEVGPKMIAEAEAYFAERVGDTIPFFAYVSMYSPHKPWHTTPEFVDSEGFRYGDFMHEVDDRIGRILDAIDNNGFRENTIVILTSDNGPETSAFTLSRTHGRDPNGPFRGVKRDSWEGGTRVPFIVRYPPMIEAGTASDQLIWQGDIFKTLAELFDDCLPQNVAPDAVSILPILDGSLDEVPRDAIVINTIQGQQSIKTPDGWKLIDGTGGGGNNTSYDANNENIPSARGTVGGSPKQLFYLPNDIGETNNLIDSLPNKAAEMLAMLDSIRQDLPEVVYTTNTFSPSEITTVAAAYPTDVGALQGDFILRERRPAMNEPNRHISGFVKFDISSINSFNTLVGDRAFVQFKITDRLNTVNTSSLNIARITEGDWTLANPPEYTWATASVPPIGSGSQADEVVIIDEVTTALLDTFYTVDVTSIIEKWVAGTIPNYGFGLYLSDAAQGVNLDNISLTLQTSPAPICNNACVDIKLHANLEGAYDPASGEMTTQLNTRGLLPGQTPTSNLVTPTPAGQPYNIAPWNYMGTEGANWTDANYTGDETDWVLVSFRTGIEKNTEVGMTAALLTKDGSIKFPNRCALLYPVTNPIYIALEHRNHIGILTPQAINVVGNTLTYDFRLSDSYRDVTSFGQKQISTGEWSMYAGDANQLDFPSFDINGTDKTIWFDNNGIFDYYFSPDFNLDGDINGQDKSLWFDNNGISSRVPK